LGWEKTRETQNIIQFNNTSWELEDEVKRVKVISQGLGMHLAVTRYDTFLLDFAPSAEIISRAIKSIPA
jgi:hypothetical protein